MTRRPTRAEVAAANAAAWAVEQGIERSAWLGSVLFGTRPAAWAVEAATGPVLTVADALAAVVVAVKKRRAA